MLAGLRRASFDGFANGTDERVYVRGDQTANYGAIMKVMGVLSKAGFSKIGLITAQDEVR